MTFRYVLSRYTDAMRGREPSVEAWTAVSDIGETFNGEVLPASEYVSVESQLVEAGLRFAEERGVQSFTLGNALRSDDPSESVDLLRSSRGAEHFEEGQQLDLVEASDALRFMLREELGGVLESEAVNIYAGFDFYLHVEAKQACPASVESAKSAGLTVSETRVEA